MGAIIFDNFRFKIIQLVCMRNALVFFLAFFSISVCAQNIRKPIEGSIGIGLYQLTQPTRYTEQSILDKTGIRVTEAENTTLYWNDQPVYIREYHFGLSTLMRQGPKYLREWLFNIEAAGQFRHQYIVTGISESLLEERVLDSTSSERTLEQQVRSISAINDLFILRPSLAWRHHLNRRWNVRSDLRLNLGIPIRNGYEVGVFSGTVQQTITNGRVTFEERQYPADAHNNRFVKSKGHFALGGALSLGAEFRVFENRSTFLNTSAVVGRQVMFPRHEKANVEYAGLEFRIISRF